MRYVGPGVVLCLLLATACGDNDDLWAVEDPARFVEALPLAHCRHLIRCGRFETAAGCLPALNVVGESERAYYALTRYDQRWPDAVARGAATFDRDEASACLAALANGSCDRAEDALIDTSACERAMRPTVPAGQPSRYPFECVSGTWAEGAPYCDTTTECCAVACAEAPAPGDIGAPCVEVRCREGLVCAGGTCAVRPGPGGACRDSVDCADVHACTDGVCTPAEDICPSVLDFVFCRHYGEACGRDGCGPRARLGEACGSGDRYCRLDLACSEAGRCVVPSVEILAEGQRCALGDRCADGLYCGGADGSLRVCSPLLADGAPCVAAYQCASGHCRGEVCTGPLTCP